MIFIEGDVVEDIIKKSNDHPNTKFLKASHNLWKRFHNYDKSPPMALKVDNDIVCIHFATFNKNGYTNSYEIVTMAGQEGKGYARKIWDEYLYYAYHERKMTRLKNSCIESSITWHNRNGLIFWGIDPTGSLKTDQPIFPSIEAQVEARKSFLKNPELALPEDRVIRDLFCHQLDDYSFGVPKTKRVKSAIQKAGENWLGDWLVRYVRRQD